ncbi:hypothetical protein GCM10028790_35360 [Micromonospora taraxaci]|uniref:Uncharacterized protein n=1 Tax=Micromonospora taraxaci TaxID=1316803 RepID=A0A561VZU7_9ACTN|nr:hypothetical protein [Micromonospora taraxaci]TWG17130.1 hypothetical protein FHU34_112471 [Micromonospora taraxaci]
MARREGDKNCCRKQSAGTEEGPELQDDPIEYDERFALGTSVNGAECAIEGTWLLPPAGRYRVDLLVMDGLMAAARLCIRDESAASWEEAS